MSDRWVRTPAVLNRPQRVRSRRGRVRSITGNVNQLGVWRLRAGLSQEVLGGLLSRDAPFVSKMERRQPAALANQRGLILDWAAACGVKQTAVELQQFLLDTGSAPWLPDAAARRRVAAFAADQGQC